MSTLEQDSNRIERKIIEIRRKLHSEPELSFQEFKTSKFVAENLREMGINVRTNVGGNGVIGILKGGKDGKVVALRADMDALPVTEEVDVPFKSKKVGIMHACGHDTHVAMLLGAAMLLSKHKQELNGTVKFLFQPAEEDGGIGGAKPMIEDGVMENPRVDYVFGLHIWSEYPSKTFGLRSGPFMATPDSFEIKILGKGGHGSRPDQTIDPIFVSAQLINALQAVSSRMLSPIRPFVLSVCSIHSGTKDNIIPNEALLQGTMRTLDEKTRRMALRYVRRITNEICRAFGANYVLKFMKDPYPITYNDERATRRAFNVLKSIKGTRTMEIDVKLGAEDFARFLQKAPGVFYFIGTRNEKKKCVAPNHSSKFKVDEDILKYGALSLASLALNFGRP